LADSERRLRDIEALAHVGDWFVDTGKGTVEWSEELYRIHGVEPGQFAGTYEVALAFIHPDDRRGAAALRLGAEPGMGPIEGEHRIIRPDGQVRWLRVRSEQVVDGAGVVVGLRGTSQDVTAEHDAAQAVRAAYDRERDAAERLRAADRVKDDFLATVSHELRTPLTTILGFAPLLRDPRDAATAAGVAERIERNARDMLAMVEQLLDISRLAAGAVEVMCEVVASVDDLVATVLEDGAVADRRIKFVGGCAGVSVRTDPEAVRHILGNLLSNAARFSPPDGIIEVATTAAAGAVVVTVADSGPGIAPELQERVFERFFRGPGQPPGARGTGVGLAIARRYAELQGGRIWCTSEGPGSVFSFTVPEARPRRRSASPAPRRSVRNP